MQYTYQTALDFAWRLTLNEVHYRLEGQDLIIRSEKSGAVHEVIPLSRLEGDFPHFMIHEYFHWFDLRSQHVEWRPRSQLWSPSSDEWKLVREDEGYVLKKGELISNRGPK